MSPYSMYANGLDSVLYSIYCLSFLVLCVAYSNVLSGILYSI